MTSNDLNPYILKSTAHYMQWWEHVATSLWAWGLWNFVFNDVKEPMVLKEETNTARYIRLCLSPHFQSMIKGKEDYPWAIMWHLDKELQPKTNTTHMDLLHSFISIHCKPKEEIKVFFMHIEATQAELKESGMVASPAYQLLAILNSLPPKYNAIHAIIKLEDKINIDQAKCLIHQQDSVFMSQSQLTAVNTVGQTCGKPNTN